MGRRVAREVSSEAEEVREMASIIQGHTIEAEVVEAMEGTGAMEEGGYQEPAEWVEAIRGKPE